MVEWAWFVRLLCLWMWLLILTRVVTGGMVVGVALVVPGTTVNRGAILEGEGGTWEECPPWVGQGAGPTTEATTGGIEEL